MSQRIFRAAPSMLLKEHRGLFLKTLSSSRFRSTAFNWEVWDFAIDLTGVEQVLLIKSFFILMQCTEEGDREVLQGLSPWVDFFAPFGPPFPGALLFYSFCKCSLNNKG